MGDHFAAFSFVDRIRDCTRSGPARARVLHRSRRRSHAFPSCLVAEAVGQLAAWVAMDAHRLSRPAGRGAGARDAVPARVEPGETLELAVEHRELRRRSGLLSRMGGRRWRARDRADRLPRSDAAARRIRCAGRRCASASALLCGAGAPPGRFRGVDGCRVEARDDRARKIARPPRLHVPAAAPFFADHFPRRPVFPATLLLDAQIAARAQCSRRSNGAGTTLVRRARMTNVKMRSFTAPGQVARDLRRARRRRAKTRCVASLTARAEGQMVATARVDLARRPTI